MHSDVPARLGLKAPALARLIGLTAFKNASRAVSPTDGSALARLGLSPGLSGRRMGRVDSKVDMSLGEVSHICGTSELVYTPENSCHFTLQCVR